MEWLLPISSAWLVAASKAVAVVVFASLVVLAVEMLAVLVSTIPYGFLALCFPWLIPADTDTKVTSIDIDMLEQP